MQLKMSAKWRQFYLGLNVLIVVTVIVPSMSSPLIAHLKGPNREHMAYTLQHLLDALQYPLLRNYITSLKSDFKSNSSLIHIYSSVIGATLFCGEIYVIKQNNFTINSSHMYNYMKREITSFMLWQSYNLDDTLIFIKALNSCSLISRTKLYHFFCCLKDKIKRYSIPNALVYHCKYVIRW